MIPLLRNMVLSTRGQTNGHLARIPVIFCFVRWKNLMTTEILKGKADMFAKRTIKKAEVVTSVDTSSEALTISLSEKGKIDLPFMSKLVGKDTDTLVNELTGIIFKNPENDLWETADHYLSGNVREKLSIVRTLVESHPEYAPNVKALTQVQPKELDASRK